jgi:hypothetical protein
MSFPASVYLSSQPKRIRAMEVLPNPAQGPTNDRLVGGAHLVLCGEQGNWSNGELEFNPIRSHSSSDHLGIYCTQACIFGATQFTIALMRLSPDL